MLSVEKARTTMDLIHMYGDGRNPLNFWFEPDNPRGAMACGYVQLPGGAPDAYVPFERCQLTPRTRFAGLYYGPIEPPSHVDNFFNAHDGSGRYYWVRVEFSEINRHLWVIGKACDTDFSRLSSRNPKMSVSWTRIEPPSKSELTEHIIRG